MTKKVLVAEDNDSIRQLVLIALRHEGIELHEAADGAEAVDKALEIVPDLLILDIMMPHKTGYEVCEIVKNNPATQNVTVMFMTSRTGAPAEMAMRKAGCADILSKPFNPTELKKKVRALLDAPAPEAREAGKAGG